MNQLGVITNEILLAETYSDEIPVMCRIATLN